MIAKKNEFVDIAEVYTTFVTNFQQIRIQLLAHFIYFKIKIKNKQNPRRQATIANLTEN